MAIDMAQFHQMFFDECEEMLERAWRLLGNGEHFPRDGSDVEGLYRCVHSIKGGGETFGFTPIGRIASALESSLDQVRSGQSKMDSDFGGAFREALDALRMHVAAYRKGLSPREDAANVILSRLHALRTGREGQAGVDRDRVLELRFRMSHTIVGSELMMDFVLEELGRIGQVLATRGPAEDRSDDEWQVDILTSAGEAPLRAILDRIAEPGSLRIALRAGGEALAGAAGVDSTVDDVAAAPVAATRALKGGEGEAGPRRRGMFLSFMLGTQRYAVDAGKVSQLAAYREATRIAGCPRFVRGVGEVDGRLVPVLDLRLCLGAGSAEITPFTTQIVADCDERCVSMLVDSVDDLLMLSLDDIRPLPRMPVAEGSALHISGLVVRDEGLVMMLDIEDLIRTVWAPPQGGCAHGLAGA